MMMDTPLSIGLLLDRAGTFFRHVEVVSRRPDRSLARSTYGDLDRRARQLASALHAAGIRSGDRVATLMWSHAQHLEAYFGIPIAGGVLHPLNMRLDPSDLAYVVNQAEDRILIVDDVLLPVYERVSSKVAVPRVLVVPSTGQPVPKGYESYESFLAEAPDGWRAPQIDEKAAAVLSYTSGTTGRPKGVLYSHRSIVLHALCGSMQDYHNVTQYDCVLGAVAMFHVMGWGLPFLCPMSGAKLVLPAQHFDAAGLLQLLEEERVTRAAAATTVWVNVLEMLDANPGQWKLQPGLRAMCGGSSIPRHLISGMSRHGIYIFQGWGMTETGPLAAICHPKAFMREWPEEQQWELRAKNGLPSPFTESRIMNEEGLAARDGAARGELQVRGPWVASAYYKAPEQQLEKWTDDGWFRTGDVATIDAEGYIHIVDRTKDMIKSGGEWISSVDLENALLMHPGVRDAAVIAVPHPKWQERPLAIVAVRDNAEVTPEDLYTHLCHGFQRWQLPDDFVFVTEIPRTSIGKLHKAKLREMFADWKWKSTPQRQPS
jgi:fatty-acyl-CoA synthase